MATLTEVWVGYLGLNDDSAMVCYGRGIDRAPLTKATAFQFAFALPIVKR